MAGRQRAGGAGGARGDREAGPVQLAQQRLAVDIEAGEGQQVRQPAHRVAEHRQIGHQPRQLGPEPVDPGRLDRVQLFGLLPDGAQRHRGGDHPRQVDVAGHPPGLAVVGRQRGAVANALADRQHADPGRAAPLVGGGGQQRPALRHRQPSGRLGRVHQQRHPGRRAVRADLGHRLDRAHLVVGRLEAGERGAG